MDYFLLLYFSKQGGGKALVTTTLMQIGVIFFSPPLNLFWQSCKRGEADLNQLLQPRVHWVRFDILSLLCFCKAIIGGAVRILQDPAQLLDVLYFPKSSQWKLAEALSGQWSPRRDGQALALEAVLFATDGQMIRSSGCSAHIQTLGPIHHRALACSACANLKG